MKDRSVLVTGAGSGIGQAVAIAMAREGGLVTLADIDGAAVKVTSAMLPDTDRCQTVICDVTDAASVAAAVSASTSWQGKLDVTVNCAGVLARSPILDLSEEEWDRVIDVNLKGTFLVGQASGRQMAQQTAGVIINISSTQAEVANADSAHYTASKGGVRALTKALAVGLAEFGIRVNAVGPGPVRTAITRERMDDPARLPTYLNRILRGRVGEPEDVAAAVLFLASDDADWITGTTLYIDGGMLACR
jgi:glucose 1-dehydrogenase